jgi:hypothetical protein
VGDVEGEGLSDGRQAKAILLALRCHPDTLLDALSALREAFVDLAARGLGSPSLTALAAASRRPRRGAESGPGEDERAQVRKWNPFS